METSVQLTLMLCGPHERREWSPLYHRIDHAIHVAAGTRSPLLVTGDAFKGSAVMHFVDRAESRVHAVFGAYDPGGRTLTDAQVALRTIRDRHELSRVREVLVVTDDWHFDRALAMLDGERKKILPGRDLSFVNATTDAGPRPPSGIIEGERRGTIDYLEGNPYLPFGEPYGKPAHPSHP